METIFTLIIVLLPIIFKLIGKKLEQSGAQPQHSEQQEQIEDWAEVLRRHIEAQQVEVETVKPVQEPLVQKPQPQQTRKPKPVKSAKPILQEEEPKKKEKIDTKKLIMYSEIMKPKYDE